MELQHQRIQALCDQLKLEALAEGYPQLASKAVSNQLRFADFLESLLKTEVTARSSRSRQMLVKRAGFPVIKTLGRVNTSEWLQQSEQTQ